MLDQLEHLLRLSKRKNIEIRVIEDIGFHAGITGSFRLTEFEAIDPVVHVEGAVSKLFLEREEEIQVYRDILAELDALALGEEESRERIAQWATDLE